MKKLATAGRMADESKYPTRIAPYGLRIPPDLKARIQAAAEKNARPMHTEIIEALERAFPDLSPTREILREIENAIELMRAEGVDPPNGNALAPKTKKQMEYIMLLEHRNSLRRWLLQFGEDV